MNILVKITIASIIAVIGLLVFLNPGRVRPILDANGDPVTKGIAEKIHVNINGVEQGMFVRSVDPAHPVLLYVHGGPAMPLYFMEQRYPTGLEANFTVVWWDQRGAGLSFHADIPSETMTVQQLVADTVAVTDYLRRRFGKEKIYLLGHSWGSFIGIQAARSAPERYHAYIGVGQISRQLVSERLAYEHMLAAFKAQGNTDMVRKLEDAAFVMSAPLPASYMAVRDEAMHSLGVGTTRQMQSVISGIFLPVWMHQEYTLREKLNIWRGKWSAHSERLWNQVLTTDVTATVRKLDIPVYFLHGKHDYTTSYTLAKNYFQQLEAPLKGFYTYEHSAHSPVFEEAARTREILVKDVLGGTHALRDPD